MLKPFTALIGALFILLTPAAALAQTATYNVSGTFDLPATGTYSGSYVVNTTNNTIVSANFTSTSGTARDGATVIPASSFISARPNTGGQFVVAASLPANGVRGAQVTLTSIVAPSSFVEIREAVCDNADCSSLTGNNTSIRVSSTGTVALAVPTPVPSLSDWALILFGLMLAGGAALYVQRRQIVT